MEARESFVFYRSFYEAIKGLPRDVQGEVYTAIMEYGLYGITTDNLKPTAKAMFMLMKPQIDANTQRYLNGKNGGRPPKEKPNNNQTITKQKPNVNDNVNVNDIKEIDKEKAKRFSPPSLDEVVEYFVNEKSVSSSEARLRANKFFLHYDSVGWKVGKNKMVNWKSAATKSLSWEITTHKQPEYERIIPKCPDVLQRGG